MLSGLKKICVSSSVEKLTNFTESKIDMRISVSMVVKEEVL
jgi:hypothetical protein